MAWTRTSPSERLATLSSAFPSGAGSFRANCPSARIAWMRTRSSVAVEARVFKVGTELAPRRAHSY